jgi:hypothetical protein
LIFDNGILESTCAIELECLRKDDRRFRNTASTRSGLLGLAGGEDAGWNDKYQE